MVVVCMELWGTMQYGALNTVPVHKHDFSRQDRAEHERAQLGATGNYTAEVLTAYASSIPHASHSAAVTAGLR